MSSDRESSSSSVTGSDRAAISSSSSSDTDGDSNCNWIAHHSSLATQVPEPKPRWNFLGQWLHWINFRCAISDSERVDSHVVRIGREMHDMWIDFYVPERVGFAYRGPPRSPAERQAIWDARKSRAREAVLLLTAMSRIDYASWIGAMVRTATFKLPKYLALQHSPEIARQFCFYLNPFMCPKDFQWKNLKRFMGDGHVSEECAEDMVDIQEIARHDGYCADLFAAIPIKLAVEPGERKLEDELAILRRITRTVRALLAINARNTAMTTTGTARTRPWFRLDSIDLYLRGFTLHPDVFDAIRELLETGVTVDTLTLPSLLPSITHHPNQAHTSVAWAELIVVVLGHRHLASGNRVRLGRLYVDGFCMTEQFLIPLCSALRHTVVVKHLWLAFERFYEESSASQRRSGAWLSYALLGPTASNAVATLELNSLTFESTALDTLVPGTVSVDPVGHLWDAIKNCRARSICSSPARRTVIIASGATITARGIQGRALKLTIRSSFAGTVVRDESHRSIVDVLVPGLGFCQVPREKIAPVDHIEPTHLEDVTTITTLVVDLDQSLRDDGRRDEHVTMMRTFTERLLRSIGPTLTALSLRCDLLDATDLDMVSRLCPCLQSLCVRGITIDTMDALTRMYEAPVNCRIASLDLSHLHVPIQAVEHFLRVLTPTNGLHPIQKMLQRLRVGQGYSRSFREETRHGITRMLCHNVKLTHFLQFELYDDDDRSSDDDDRREDVCKPFNRQLLPQYPFRFDRKLAFLSAVRVRGSQTRPENELGSDLIQYIFSFAADRVWRRAFTLRDEDSEIWLD